MKSKGKRKITKASRRDGTFENPAKSRCTVNAILLDFGGVLADEGFRNGLRAIAEGKGLDPNEVEKIGFEVVHQTGFVTGQADEESFWRVFKLRTGVSGNNLELKKVILTRFRLRRWMLALLPSLKEAGLILGILSDQTNWLDELNEQKHFFKWFDHIFNSFYMGKSKRDATLFDDISLKLNIPASKILFVDDHPGNIERAQGKGYQTHLYIDREGLLELILSICPGLN